jgi:hypothetical protein
MYEGCSESNAPHFFSSREDMATRTGNELVQGRLAKAVDVDGDYVEK